MIFSQTGIEMVQTRRKTAAAAQDGAVKENKAMPSAPQTPTKNRKRGRPPKIKSETSTPSNSSTLSAAGKAQHNSDDKVREPKLRNGCKSQDDDMLLINGIASSSKEEKCKVDDFPSPKPIFRRKTSSEEAELNSSSYSSSSKRVSINRLKAEEKEDEEEIDDKQATASTDNSQFDVKISNTDDPVSPLHPDDPQPSTIPIAQDLYSSASIELEPSSSTSSAAFLSKSEINSASTVSSGHSLHQAPVTDDSECMDIADSESEGENSVAEEGDNLPDDSSSSIPLPSSTPPKNAIKEIHVDVEQPCSATPIEKPPWDRSDERNEKSNTMGSPGMQRPKIHFLHPAFSSFPSDTMTSPNPVPPEPGPKSNENGASVAFKMTFKKTPMNPLLKASALEQPSTSSAPYVSATAEPSAVNESLASPQKRSSNFGTATSNVLPPPQMVELPKLSFFNNASTTKPVIPEEVDSVQVEISSPKPSSSVTTSSKHSETELQAAKKRAEKVAQDIERRRHEEGRHKGEERREEGRYKEERDDYERRRDERDRKYRKNDYDRKYDSDRKNDFEKKSDQERKNDSERKFDMDRRSESDRNEQSSRVRQREDDERRAREREREVTRRHDREREEERIQKLREEKRKNEEAERKQREIEEKQKKEEELKKLEEKKIKDEEKRLKEEEMKIPEFELITECKYLTRSANKKRTESLLCECGRTGGTCSDNTCVNRAMMTECPSSCTAKCKNQRFAKKKIASVEAYHTGTAKGCGLRALKDIKKGRFIIEYIGEVVERDDYEKRKLKYAADKKHKHHYLCDTGIYTIDATVYGNASRFVNHSCDPNAVCEKWSVPKTPGDISRIGFFAKKFIKSGEEITFDYQFVNYGRDAQQCLCGAPSCTGWIGEKPEECSSSDEDDDDVITTSHITMDEDQEEKLEELADLDSYQRTELINEMLEDLNLRTKKHARKVITIATRMTDHAQREQLLKDIFSTDTNLALQTFYAKEGMASLMGEWLEADDYTLPNLQLVQVILQTLHGDAFLSCARSDSLLLEVVTRWSESTPGPWVNIHAVMNALVACTEAPEKDYKNVAEEAEKEIVDNFNRAKEMAYRLNHHWFYRSVSFRIPKKKPTVERNASRNAEASSSSSQLVETSQNRNSSPVYNRHRHHYNTSYYNNDQESHPRFFNNGNDVHQYRFTGYHGNNYKENYLTRRQNKDTYRDRRRGARRSRSRSRSISPQNYKRRKVDDRDNHRNRSPVADRRVASSEDKSKDSVKNDRDGARSVAVKEEMDTPSVSEYAPRHPSYPLQPGFEHYGLYDVNTGVPYNAYHQNPAYYPHPYSVPQVPLAIETLPNKDSLYILYDKATLEQLCSRLQSVEEEVELLKGLIQQRREENAAAERMEAERRRQEDVDTARKIQNMKYVWATAKDPDGQTYYYNKVTKETQWHLPTAEQGLLEPEGYVCPVMAQVAEEQRQREKALKAESKVDSLEPVQMEFKQELEDNEGETKDRQKRSTTEKSSVSPKPHRDREYDRERDRREDSRSRDHNNKDSCRESMASERRIREFKQELERSIRSEVRSHSRLQYSQEATSDKTTWLIKLIAKEMLKRESSQHKFDFQFSENTDKKVRNYTKSLIDRKLESNDLWKGYSGR
ncbi:hypothetical protein L3Y34_015356 [Caenorhabditis briggsae]|uniref:Protein CBR-MET-1 n=1 Tax=Caenorhabditis briggsae TaxID=6238 RepID=A0AAE9DTG4_CAEBR|nr:hypothetical protein L3Y34_015356 [Caenorhabditis briggsae]